MDFAAFLVAVGARPSRVARETGLHASTIGRIRDGDQVPDGRTMLLLDAWAERAAQQAGTDARLTWDHLLCDAAEARP